MWDQDTKQKFIQHNPEYKIPLMPVNEGEGKFTSFLATVGDKLMDKGASSKIELFNAQMNQLRLVT